MKKMKILLHAYINQNIGDDLFLDLILKRYPNIDFYLYVPKRIQKYYSTFSKNLTVISYNETGRFFQKLDGKLFKGYFTSKKYYLNLCRLHKKYTSKMNAQIWLGGSQFVETSDWKRILNYKQYQQTAEIPFYAISATVGPIRTQEYLEKVRNIVAGYSDFCCRDLESYRLLGSGTNTRVAPDMVFSIPVKSLEKKRLVCVSVINVRKRFGVESGRKYEKFVLDLINKFIKQEYKIVLISFCENQRDTICCRKLYDQVSDKKQVECVVYDDNLQEIVNLFSEAKYVIGTRYHSIVLGLRYGAKVLPIIYESKTKNLLDDIQKQGISVDDILQEGLLNLTDKWIELNSSQINLISKKSEEQFMAVDGFVSRFCGGN